MGKIIIKDNKIIFEDIKPGDLLTHIITAAHCVYENYGEYNEENKKEYKDMIPNLRVKLFHGQELSFNKKDLAKKYLKKGGD